MRIKKDEAGHVVLDKNDNPIYVHDDGKELPFDAKATVTTISRLNGEAKARREEKEAAEARLQAFGDMDPEAAMKALDTVGKLSDKKLIEAGEVDKVRDAAKRGFDEQLKALDEKYAPVMKERDSLKAALVSEKVGGSFARSKYIQEKLAIPADMVQARFGDMFKLEGDAIVAYDKTGNKVYSRAKPGEVADFDEALEITVDNYPQKDYILKGSGARGGGAQGGSGGGSGRTYTRAQFDQMDPATKMATAKSVNEGQASLVD